MTSALSVNSAALLILRQANLSAGPASETRPGDDLLATANGVARPSVSGAGGATQEARAKISEALFNPQVPDATQMKISLMRRLGEEFGLDLDAFESQASFGAAIERIVGAMKLQSGGALVLREIERKLGLDELGVSLDTLVNAIIDPEGSDGQKLNAAIKKHLGEDVLDTARLGAPAAGRTDADGLCGGRGPA